MQQVFEFCENVLIERCITNLREINCSVVGDFSSQEVSVLEEPIKEDEILSYKDKYLGGGKSKVATKGSKGMASTNRVIPARLDEKTTNKVKEIAKDVFRALNLSGVCRIDFLIDGKSNKIYINEPNTIPGSLSFYLWEATDKPYEQLLDEMITLAIKQYKQKHQKTYSFDTNILSNFSGSKGVKGKLK